VADKAILEAQVEAALKQLQDLEAEEALLLKEVKEQDAAGTNAAATASPAAPPPVPVVAAPPAAAPAAVSIAQRAAAFATPFEGTFLEAYADPAGVWTIGTGSIWDRRNTPPTRVTQHTPPIDAATALAWLAEEMTEAVGYVAHYVTVPITDNQRVALTDLIYNIGAGNFASSRLLRSLNSGDITGASDYFLDWTMAGGHQLRGLVRRRAAERTLFMTGE